MTLCTAILIWLLSSLYPMQEAKGEDPSSESCLWLLELPLRQAHPGDILCS